MVQFANQAASSTPSMLPSNPQVNPFHKRGPEEIKDLCHTIRNHFSNPAACHSLAGFIQDGMQRSYSLRVVKRRENPEDCDPFWRLQSLISKRGRTRLSGEIKLKSLKRLQLACTLSSAVLQLHSTPWLDATGIGFDNLYLRASKTLIQSPKLGTYVSKKFLCQAGSAQGQIKPMASQTTKVGAPWIRNATLYTHAMALIQLCFNQTIEELAEEADLGVDGQRNVLTQFATAYRLLESCSIINKFGIYYHNAIRCCLFPPPDTNFMEEDTQQRFYSEVVLPIQRIGKQFGISV